MTGTAMVRRTTILASVVACLVVAGATVAAAQSDYPSKPVLIIVPTGAGGSTDSTARNVANYLTKALGQSFIVENKPGALGRVAVSSLLQQPSDGYTLFLMAASQTVLPALYEVPFDMARDFTPIALLSTTPSMLLVNKSLPITTVSDLITYAKQHPNEVAFGYQGGPLRLAAEAFNEMTGIRAVGVPFNSSAQAMSELVGGRLTFLLASAEVARPQAEAGTVRAIATFGDKRARIFPDIPSVHELGYDLDGSGWFGLVGPRDLPRSVLDKLYSTLRGGYFGKEHQETLMKGGLEPADEGPEQFKARLTSSVEYWRKTATRLRFEIERAPH